MEAELLLADGERQKVSPKNGKDFDLQELQGFVGGFIEIVRLRGNKMLVINEEGKLNNLPMNYDASELFYRSFPSVNDFIVGNALYCDSEMVK